MKTKKLTIFAIFLLLTFLFWWFQVRPSSIRSECATTAKERAVELTRFRSEQDPSSETLRAAAVKGLYLTDTFNNVYETCLKQKGL